MKKASYLILIFFLILTSCDDAFLDKKPNKAIVVPSTLADLQALLDNAGVMNVVPGLGLGGTDDWFMNEVGYNFLTQPAERNSYTWVKDFYQGAVICSDWNTPYQQVFYSNVVLEALTRIDRNASNETQWQTIKGSALFFRAHAFYQVAQVFAEPYPGSSNALGIPVRLTADVNAPVFRASLNETYTRILTDLEEALDLLPTNVGYKTRPGKNACNALLARIHLSMQNYTLAEQHANAALSENKTLLDYNTLNPATMRPVPRMNDEMIFYSNLITYKFTTSPYSFADTALYATYSDNDLRKLIFFRQRATNRFTFRGNYTGNATMFGGLANDEVYLTRAECRVRNGNVDGALDDLNALLINRFATGTFTPITEKNAGALLQIVLNERRKELIFRGIRWTDLRRLNQDPVFAKTLHRKLSGNDYSLPPQDIRYTLPIPEQEIHNSGIKQNAR